MEDEEEEKKEEVVVKRWDGGWIAAGTRLSVRCRQSLFPDKHGLLRTERRAATGLPAYVCSPRTRGPGVLYRIIPSEDSRPAFELLSLYVFLAPGAIRFPLFRRQLEGSRALLLLFCSCRVQGRKRRRVTVTVSKKETGGSKARLAKARRREGGGGRVERAGPADATKIIILSQDRLPMQTHNN